MYVLQVQKCFKRNLIFFVYDIRFLIDMFFCLFYNNS